MEARGGQRDPEDREGGAGARPDHGGADGLTIAERHLDLPRAGNDVRVGEDVTVAVKDDPRTDGLSASLRTRYDVGDSDDGGRVLLVNGRRGRRWCRRR